MAQDGWLDPGLAGIRRGMRSGSRTPHPTAETRSELSREPLSAVEELLTGVKGTFDTFEHLFEQLTQ